MQAILRERILERLLALRSITEKYAARDPSFPGAVGDWHDATARVLGELRHPLAGLAAAERGRVIAAADGLRDPDERAERTTTRRSARAVAAASLARTEQALRGELAQVEARLMALRSQIAEMVARVHAQNPIAPRGDRPREAWLRGVWRSLNGEPKARAQQAYLAGLMPWVDRLYVLGEVLDNLMEDGERPRRGGDRRRSGAAAGGATAGSREAGQ